MLSFYYDLFFHIIVHLFFYSPSCTYLAEHLEYFPLLTLNDLTKTLQIEEAQCLAFISHITYSGFPLAPHENG